MILMADTNVVIEFFKALRKDVKDSPYTKAFERNEIVLCGMVRAEILHGAYSEKNRDNLLRFMALYPSVDIKGAEWEDFGNQLYEYRTHGLTVPTADAIIASIAIKHGISIWTDDKHFHLMQSVIPKLSIVRTEDLV